MRTVDTFIKRQQLLLAVIILFTVSGPKNMNMSHMVIDNGFYSNHFITIYSMRDTLCPQDCSANLQLNTCYSFDGWMDLFMRVQQQ